MRYFITSPFTYRTQLGATRYMSPNGPAGRIFDTDAPELGVDATFIPPPLGLEPMDAEAKVEIDAVRAPYAGRQLPGIGVLPADTPIYNP